MSATFFPLAVALLVTPLIRAQPAEAQTCPQTLGSDKALSQQYRDYKKSIETGPLLRHLGRPVSCTARSEGGAIWLSYGFAKGVKLEAHRDPALELSEQQLTEPGLSKQMALTLLRRTEKWAFDSKGCGIRWNRPPAKEKGSAPDTSEMAYRGETCNCQGRLVYSGSRLQGVIFRSAC